MRVLLERDDALNALEIIKRALGTYLHAQVYVHVNSTVTISMWSKSAGISVTLPNAIVQEAGVALLSYDRLLSYVQQLPHGQMMLEVVQPYLFVTMAHHTGKFTLLPTETYSTVLTMLSNKSAPLATLSSQEFCSIIDDVSFAADKITSGHQLFFACILLQPARDGGLDVFASDASCMAHRTVEVSHAMHNQMVVPAVELESFALAVGKVSKTIAVSTDATGHIAFFTDETVDYYVRMLNGLYPAFRNLYPTHYDLQMNLETNALIEAVNLASTYQTGKVLLSTSENSVLISSLSTEEGESVSSVPCVIAGQEGRVKLNVCYFLDALAHIHTPTLTINCVLQGQQRLVVLSPSDKRVLYSLSQSA